MNRPVDPSKANGSAKPFAVTTGSLPASLKTYTAPPKEFGDWAHLKVPFREVATGEGPFRIYDPSGPYTDPRVQIDVNAGLSPVRAEWIAQRGDARVYFGRKRKPEDNGDVGPDKLVREFTQKRAPVKASPTAR